MGGVLEPTVAHAAQDDVATAAQDSEVDAPVAVDVDWIGAGDTDQVGDGRCNAGELERAAHRALVPVERRWLTSPGEEQLVAPVVVAVEGGHAASDEELRSPGVGVVDPSGDRLVHEMRRFLGACARGAAAVVSYREQHNHSSADHRHCDRTDQQSSGLHIGHGGIEPHSRRGFPAVAPAQAPRWLGSKNRAVE